jgi:hypothetical protein
VKLVLRGSRHFLHVALTFKDAPKPDELQPVFDKASDWIRYAPNCWLLWTARSAEQWFELLKPHLGPKDQMFICRLDMRDRQGWLARSVWEWIDKKLLPPAKTTSPADTK